MQAVSCRAASFDQRYGQSELLPQPLFFSGHLTVVALMIVSRQVQDAVQGKNLDFFGGGMSEAAGILGGDLGRDRHISREIARFGGVRRKTEHVRGLVLATETFVQNAKGLIGCDEDRQLTTQSDGTTGAAKEPVERGLAEPWHALFQNHHSNR